ncbi:unnamed protein product [Urochloa humidicola]
MNRVSGMERKPIYLASFHRDNIPASMSIPALLLLIVTLCAGGAPRRCAAAVPRATDAMDVRAMQAIAKSTGADKSLGWGAKSVDPCGGTWPGVRCDTGEGRVTSIDASNGGLVGRISGADLSDLSFLSSLDLSFNFNRLDGDLPALPRPLSYLTTLNLSSNSFLGIPDSFFSSFPALETFAIDDNTVIMGRVPGNLARCPALTAFSANNVTLFGPVPDFFGDAATFPALERLSLARNNLLASIEPGFGKNSKIKFLDLSSQIPLTQGDSLTGHLDFVAGMTDLVEIHVGGNAFYGPLPDASGLVNLKVFDAPNNKLCGQVKFAPGVAVNVDGNPGVGKDC